MARKCNLPGRNLCAPGDTIAALFVDIDGTCTVCQPYFDGALNEFGALMELAGLTTKASAVKVIEKVYYGSMPQRGFERWRLGEAIEEAYLELCKLKGVKPKKDLMSICHSIGSRPFFRQPEVFPNCIPVLTRASHNFFLVAVTVGDREAQKHKIRQAGLDAIFDQTIITLHENKDEMVAEAIEDLGIDPHYSAFIGNSIRSDGVTLSKTNFIYLPLEQSLVRPTDKLPEGTGFTVYNARDWREAEERGIIRLLRRRHVALEAEMLKSESPQAVLSRISCEDNLDGLCCGE